MSKPNPEIVESADAPNDAVGTKADLASAKRVLGIEAAAITNLAESLGEPFLRALDIMDAVQGRVVVTGMGKSGHICNKIVATLSSTGTPALFVHPAEASHGDLGMIAKGDAVFALSNSGETTELADLVAYAKRFEIPLIAVTGGADSALAEAADVSLVLPQSEEACPMGLAPTTSTTVMMGELLVEAGLPAGDAPRIQQTVEQLQPVATLALLSSFRSRMQDAMDAFITRISDDISPEAGRAMGIRTTDLDDR